MSSVGVSGCLELQADLVPHFPVVAFLSPSPFANNKVCTFSLGVLCSKSNQWGAEFFRAPDEQVSLTLYGVGEAKGSIPPRDKKKKIQKC